MEEGLFKAIILSGFKDLFEEEHKRSTYAWFMSNKKSGSDFISFVDACDLAGIDMHKCRQKAKDIFNGTIDKDKYLEDIAKAFNDKPIPIRAPKMVATGIDQHYHEHHAGEYHATL